MCAGSQAATFTGTVFEDANYGGGAGRSLADSSGTPLAGVRVELYRVGAGNALLDTDTTDVNGFFSVSSGNSNFQVRVRVVQGTVLSARAGGSTCTACAPVQTYRTDGATGSAVPVTNRVGGENPALSDAISNTGGSNFNSLTVAGSRVPQSVTVVIPPNGGATVSGLDFGFNFSTVVNTRDPAICTITGTSNACQGSLRQFIINANALGGEGSLAQAGSGQIDGSDSSLPAGYESSIFMIPDGTANPGQHTGYASQLTGGVAVITLNSALPAVSGANTRLDATTQTVNVGNDNAGVLGSGGTVGVDAIPLPAFPRPEVQLTSGERVVTLSGSNAAILGFALQQGYILLSGTGCLARNNLVGMTATGDSSFNSGLTYGIEFAGSNATVRNNFVTVNNSGIRAQNGGSGSLVTLNEVARPSFGHTNTFDGILLVGTVSSIQVVANLARDQEGGGIELGFGGGAAASNILISNNTVQANGFADGGGASSEPLGMVAYAYTGTSVTFSRNLVRDNAGPGIVLMNVSGTQLSQNHFSNNGGLSIDLDSRGIDPNTMTTPQGVTLNDSGDADSGPNGLRNYPVITNAVLAGGELSLAGFARPGSSIELYLAQADPSGFGEGLTYLGTLAEGGAGDNDATTGAYGPAAINGVAQGSDTTNRFSFRFTVPGGVGIGSALSATATAGGETSEFGGNVLVTAGPALLVAKSVAPYSDPVNNTSNPKSIPGALQTYTLRVTNQGAGAVDNDSVIIADQIPVNTRLFVGDLGGAGSGPIQFVDGTPGSGLSWTFTALNSGTDDVEFSSDNGATWTYVPVPDAQGCDAAVTNIRLRPKGTMPGQGGGSPSFELSFRVRVD
jgi:parallel beta-helix repeat protein